MIIIVVALFSCLVYVYFSFLFVVYIESRWAGLLLLTLSLDLQMLEGKSYKLKFPWIGVVNRSQADINKSVDMIAARRREREYFANTPEYRHLANKMGSEHLGKVLSKVNLIIFRIKREQLYAFLCKYLWFLQHAGCFIDSCEFKNI